MTKNNKKNNKKRIVAGFSLIILIFSLLALNYVKFFKAPNENIEERPVESSSAIAIQTALEDIVRNFNNSEELNDYASQGIKMKAILNQYSIFINYITDTTVTYEFSYSNLNLDITIDNEEDNIEKFNQVYSLLLKAIQKRINNTEENLDAIINKILNENKIYDGVKKEENDNTNFYQVNITKKLVENNIEIEKDNITEDNIENNLESNINNENNITNNTDNNNETE